MRVSMRLRPLIVASFALAIAAQAAAFQLVPIQATFRPTGSEAVQSFRLENPDDKPVAVELSIARRTMNPDGTDTLTPDEEDFVVVPAQVVLRPKQVQAVRVQWVGATALQGEQAFRLIAEQVPVDMGEPVKQGGHLKMLVRYLGSIYVAPAGAHPDLVVEDVERGAVLNGAQQVSLVVENRGTAHIAIHEPRLIATDAGGQRIEVAPPELAGQNFLAGCKRRFTIHLAGELSDCKLAMQLLSR